MADEADSDRTASQGLSRRELLKRAGMAGAAAAVPVMVGAPPAGASPDRESYGVLTSEEAQTLEAIVARLIPTDENGPGATEARAARYIDRALTGPLASSRQAYSAGLAAVDRYARASKGGPFARLSVPDQNAVLSDMEKNIAAGFTPNSSTFFALLRMHTIQGTFCDPYYGGNANFVGWDLIGYPGVRTFVAAGEQRLNVNPTLSRRSAYDYTMFSKPPARTR